MKKFLLLSTIVCVTTTLLTGFMDLRNAGSRSLLLVHFVRTACLVLGRTSAQTLVTWDWLSGSDKRYLRLLDVTLFIVMFMFVLIRLIDSVVRVSVRVCLLYACISATVYVCVSMCVCVCVCIYVCVCVYMHLLALQCVCVCVCV